ncbi:hypothetical protein ABDI30_06245 [Paenibacillus cisolokensis]|uniref:hypothetical protein n=1 Tax=Paenibacillus cisolokensis TaxID=1658519 RepID=UPI003D2BE870
MAAAVPFAGWVASGAKIGRNAAKLGKVVTRARRISQDALNIFGNAVLICEKQQSGDGQQSSESS